MFYRPVVRRSLSSVRRAMFDTGREALSQLAKKTGLTFQVHASRAAHGPPDGGRETLPLGAITWPS
jgi:hypothetical protein